MTAFSGVGAGGRALRLGVCGAARLRPLTPVVVRARFGGLGGGGGVAGAVRAAAASSGKK